MSEGVICSPCELFLVEDGLLLGPGALLVISIFVSEGSLFELRDGLLVDVEGVVFDHNDIARKSNHPFDHVTRAICWVDKDDHITTLWTRTKAQFLLGEGYPETVRELIDEDMVANRQRWYHRS